MVKRKKQKKLLPRDWNMVALINRSGGKGRHKSKKHRPRTTSKVVWKKSLREWYNQSLRLFFFALPQALR